MLDVDFSSALAEGLTFRPLEETVRDTLAWAERGARRAPLASGIELPASGLTPERESTLLAGWRR
jgi:2'-hydroxyisoflavone reductase